MKIIHTGDWHIGKVVNEFSMIEDQKFILDQLIKLIEDERPNALVIAGDLYDRSIPSTEAVDLLDEVFSKILLELKTPIIAIAGNHDSAERVSFASRILRNNGLHIAGVFDNQFKKVVLEDEDSFVNFYLVPYSDPREVKTILQDEEISTHDDAMRKIVERIKENMDVKQKNILIAHGFVSFMSEETAVEGNDEHNRAGLKTSDSERPLSIGGTDIISGKYFECFNYTALGHLHSPQKVGSDKIRYSGSLLKYSFSEKEHKKGVTVVNLDKDGQVAIEHKALIPRRDMRVIKGPLKELINPDVYSNGNVEDYIYAILTDEGELVDPISQLRAVYPNIMGLGREEVRIKEDSRTSAAVGYQNKSKLSLFKEFYNAISGRELAEEKINIVKDIIEAVEKEA